MIAVLYLFILNVVIIINIFTIYLNVVCSEKSVFIYNCASRNYAIMLILVLI